MGDRLVHSCDLDGRTVEIYERTALVPVGAVSVPTVVETYYVCEAPKWPKLRIRARRGFARLLYRLGRKPGLELDDPRFNEAFRVDAEDDDLAIVLLSPEMQQFLLEKRNVDWSAGHGAVKLFYRGALKKGRIGQSLERLRRFWSLVPPEMLDWAPEIEAMTSGTGDPSGTL